MNCANFEIHIVKSEPLCFWGGGSETQTAAAGGKEDKVSPSLEFSNLIKRSVNVEP